MTLVFDTSALSELLSDNDKIVRAVNNPAYDVMLIPLAADAELRYGFTYGTKTADNLSLYQHFKRDFNLEIALPDQNTALIYADLATQCRKNGISLSHNDLWIGAATVQSGGRLLTLDHDFNRLPQINLVQI